MSATIRNVPVTFIGRVVSANKSVIIPCGSPRMVRSIEDIEIFYKKIQKEKFSETSLKQNFCQMLNILKSQYLEIRAFEDIAFWLWSDGSLS